MKSIVKLSRRQFLQRTGISSAGLLLGTSIPGKALGAVLDTAAGSQLNLFVSIDESGLVEIIAHRSEMGTGIRTSLPQVVADEMEANWDRVKVIQGLANADYGSQNTDGSRSVRDFYQVMRQMGATARTLLEQAAASIWGVPVSECRAREHQVFHDSGRSLDYAQLASHAARLPLPDLTTLRLKPASDFRYIGTAIPMVDLADMVSGSATYGIDVALPGMLYASIERSPVMGGRPKTYNDKAARDSTGVVDVIEITGSQVPAFNPIAGIAVIANNTWAALQGRAKLQPQWESSAHQDYDSKVALQELAAAVKSSGEVVRQRGDTTGALAVGTRRLEAVYTTPFLAHAPMEPPVATARVDASSCEIWACTQTPQVTQREVARALGLPPAAVTVHVTLLGGGFGRKSKPDFAIEAALLARGTGRPVQVCWSREDDIRHDYFHACSAQYFSASFDNTGTVNALLARAAAPSIGSVFGSSDNLLSHGELGQGFASMPFATPNLQIERVPAPAHMRIGWLRSVYNIPFAFGVGSFVDELAHAAGREPASFWLDLIGPDRELDFTSEGFKFSNYGRSLTDYPWSTARLKGVINALTNSLPWGEELPAGQGWGLSAHRSFLSYVAVASKVEVIDGKLSVLEMHCVIDCGTVVNPDRLHSQLEGALIFGLSLALMGEISFAGGVSEQSNFHDYPVARIGQTPAHIQTHIVTSNAPPAGVGEPGVPPVAPSIANAIFAASGQRLRQLPLNRYLRV